LYTPLTVQAIRSTFSVVGTLFVVPVLQRSVLPGCSAVSKRYQRFGQLQVYKLRPQFQFFVVDERQNIFHGQQVTCRRVGTTAPGCPTRTLRKPLPFGTTAFLLPPAGNTPRTVPLSSVLRSIQPLLYHEKTPAITQHVGVADVLLVQLFSCCF